MFELFEVFSDASLTFNNFLFSINLVEVGITKPIIVKRRLKVGIASGINTESPPIYSLSIHVPFNSVTLISICRSHYSILSQYKQAKIALKVDKYSV